jgi:hypothetical protein
VVVGADKIVRDVDEGIERLHQMAAPINALREDGQMCRLQPGMETLHEYRHHRRQLPPGKGTDKRGVYGGVAESQE